MKGRRRGPAAHFYFQPSMESTSQVGRDAADGNLAPVVED